MQLPKLIILLAIILLSFEALGQDEAFMRKVLLGEFEKKLDKKIYRNKKYDIYSPMYEFDIDRDDRNEKFLYRYVDGASWLHILDYYNKKIFSYEFDVNGIHARLYKIRIRDLSPAVRVFVLFFYEGFASYLEYKGNARAYFLTIERNNLSTLSVFKGPMVWEEFKDSHVHYHQRAFDLSFKDYNKDGIKELVFDFYGIRRVYLYKGKGLWAKALNRVE